LNPKAVVCNAWKLVLRHAPRQPENVACRHSPWRLAVYQGLKKSLKKQLHNPGHYQTLLQS
jgi:hypothetical protein